MTTEVCPEMLTIIGEAKHRSGCLPNKALDYDVMQDQPYTDRATCTGTQKHPLVEKYEAASGLDVQRLAHPSTDEHVPSNAYFKATKLIKPVHIAPESFVRQLKADVQMEKITRKQIHFSNCLAELGHTVSNQWPNEYMASSSSSLAKSNFYGTTKTKDSVQSTYDAIHSPRTPDNPYGYMYKLHREDRCHAKKTGLDINGEEMERPSPGILTNSVYGRGQSVYPLERYHNVHSHKSFYRNRGVDATK